MRLAIQPVLFLSLVISLMACGTDTPQQISLPHDDLRFSSEAERTEGLADPGNYIVAFRSSPNRVERSNIYTLTPGLGQMLTTARSLLGHRSFARLNLTFPGKSFVTERSLNAHPFLLEQFVKEEDEALAQIVELNFATEESARAQISAWHESGEIYFAEPNFKSSTKGDTEERLINIFKDNSSTPWLGEVSFVEAMQKFNSSAAVSEPLIAVMDSGVDVQHPNLQDAIFLNEQGQNKQCKGDIYGCNTTVAKKDLLGDGDVFPTTTSGYGEGCPSFSGQCEHGTHVAGIIAARNSEEYTGLCPYCKILVVKVVEVENKGGEENFPIKDSSILAGLAYVSGFKSGGEPLVRVINASFGKFERSRSVELFIKSLKTFGRGTLVVAAAGNEDTMKRQYPAGFDDVMAVSNVLSSADSPRKSESSNFGTWVDIAAPGDGFCAGGSSGILSSIPGGTSACRAGTSMATPVVAGIAGLVLAREPNLSATELEKRLLQTAVPDRLYLDGINNSYRPNIKGTGLVPLLGSGVVNALTAIDPVLDTSPILSAQRPDAVRSGCGVIASGGNGSWGWLIMLPALLVALGGLKRRFK